MNIKTKIISLNNNYQDYRHLSEACKAISDGKLVAFPTETVYGLGADGLNEEAVKKIFLAKGRPQDNPLILHVDSVGMIENLAEEISEDSLKLMEKFWPGPLTLIFKRSKLVPDIITGGLDTVAIRMPDNDLARELIRCSNTAIAAPSANTSGRPSPTRAQHVYDDLAGRIDYILDGGSTGIGLESTVIDMTGDIPTILRPGGISLEELEEVLDQVREDKGLLDDSGRTVPKSPGQKYKHYAPNKEMRLYLGSRSFMETAIKEDLDKLKKAGKKVGIITTDENLKAYAGDEIISLGSQEDLETIAHRLFETYRAFDDLDVDIILSESVEDRGLGKAILNRMKKACGGNIVKER